MAPTVTDYLARLKAALQGADPALVQDALDDAEAHLKSEVADGRTAEEAVSDYGSPEEVARAYRENEEVAERHLAPPRSRRKPGGAFGVWADPTAWGSLVYFLLSLFTFCFYFTWLAVGLSLSLGLIAGIITAIVGIPLFILVMGSVRGLALFEGTLVEALLGIRMPRRARYVSPPQGVVETAKFWITDGQTWKSLAYLLLNFPVAILFFVVFMSLFATGVGLTLAPIGDWIFGIPVIYIDDQVVVSQQHVEGPALFLLSLLGVAILTGTLHLAKLLGGIYGDIVKAIHVNRTA